MKLPSIRKAIKGNVMAGVLTTVISLAIALLVLANIYSATYTNAALTNTTAGSSPANTTYAGIWSNTWTAFTLLGILVIIMAAFAIIGITRGNNGGE